MFLNDELSNTEISKFKIYCDIISSFFISICSTNPSRYLQNNSSISRYILFSLLSEFICSSHDLIVYLKIKFNKLKISS